MATYNITFYFANNTSLTTHPMNKSEDSLDVVRELAGDNWQSYTNPDGTVDLVNMRNVNFIQIEKRRNKT